MSRFAAGSPPDTDQVAKGLNSLKAVIDKAAADAKAKKYQAVIDSMVAALVTLGGLETMAKRKSDIDAVAMYQKAVNDLLNWAKKEKAAGTSTDKKDDPLDTEVPTGPTKVASPKLALQGAAYLAIKAPGSLKAIVKAYLPTLDKGVQAKVSKTAKDLVKKTKAPMDLATVKAISSWVFEPPHLTGKDQWVLPSVPILIEKDFAKVLGVSDQTYVAYTFRAGGLQAAAFYNSIVEAAKVAAKSSAETGLDMKPDSAKPPKKKFWEDPKMLIGGALLLWLLFGRKGD